VVARSDWTNRQAAQIAHRTTNSRSPRSAASYPTL
jgi:hypothetical protein